MIAASKSGFPTTVELILKSLSDHFPEDERKRILDLGMDVSIVVCVCGIDDPLPTNCCCEHVILALLCRVDGLLLWKHQKKGTLRS